MENFQKYTVVCDNPNCNYNVVNESGKVDLKELNTYLNKPCPKCGENLLTEEDYKNLVRLFKIIQWWEKWFGWLNKIFKSKKTTKVSIKVHKGIHKVD
jgi:hypothetical protein